MLDKTNTPFLILYYILIIFTVLPDSTATDLDQHLSSLVGSSNSQMTHHSILGSSQNSISSTVNGSNVNSGTNNVSTSILVPRYHSNSSNDYNVHSSQNGPRSLSDSSQTESPVQEDLLSSNTPNLGSSQNSNQNFTVINSQNQNSSTYSSSSGGNTCNGSLYPVLPASLLYSQLYTAANQSHGFHSHVLPSHSSPNSTVHGELQSVMEHINTVGNRQQHNLMSGNNIHTHDLALVGNCGASVRSIDDGNSNRQVALASHRGHHHVADNGGSVWRPY